MGMKAGERTPPRPAITVGEAREHALARGVSRGAIDRLLPASKAGDPLTAALGDPSGPMATLAQLLVGLRGDAPARAEAALHVDRTAVIESGLAVDGELLITDHVLVLGDVAAAEVTVDETGSLAVTGDVTARATYVGGYLQLAGTLSSRLITGFDGGYIRAARIACDLLILYAYSGYDAGSVAGHAFTLDHGIDAGDPGYQAAEKLVAESCLAEDEARFGVGRIDFRKLIQAAVAGERFLR